MQLRFWASTDVGRVRKHNEDNFLVDKRLNLFVVCDGMGGHAAGEVASAIGVRTVRDVIHANRDVLERHARNPDDVPTRREMLQLVEKAVLDANSRVFETSAEDESKRGMGTTCCMLLLSGKRGFIGHVGDSRIYMLRDNMLHQMTEDHSLYNEMVRMGKIKPGEHINLPNKNAVTRAVGVREHVDVDVMEFDALPGDRILACSDGLSGYFKTDEHVVGMMRGEVRDVTESFIEFAVGAGGRDNITAIVIDVDSIEPVLDEDDGLKEELLKATPYFQYLSAKEQSYLKALIETVALEPNEQLFGQEDIADLYIVMDGTLRLERHGDAFAELTAGDYTGELGFIDSFPNDYRAWSPDGARVLTLERSRFMKLLKSQPALAVKLLWNFLQMFAIKLREVPFDVRFPAAVDDSEDVTPPAGELVFHEDTLRSLEKSRASEADQVIELELEPASEPEIEVEPISEPELTPAPAPAPPPMAAPSAPPTLSSISEPPGAPPKAPTSPRHNPFAVKSTTASNPFAARPSSKAAAPTPPAPAPAPPVENKIQLGASEGVGLAEPTAPPILDADHTMDLDDELDLLDFRIEPSEPSEPELELSDSLMAPPAPGADDDLRATLQLDKDDLFGPTSDMTRPNTQSLAERLLHDASRGGEAEGLGMTPSEARRAAPSAQIMRPKKRKKKLELKADDAPAGGQQRDEDLVSTLQLDPEEIKRQLALRAKAPPVEEDTATQELVRPSPEQLKARAEGAPRPSSKIVVDFGEGEA